MREEGVVLEDHPHTAPLRRHVDAVPDNSAVADIDRPVIRSLEPGDDPQGRRLAAPRRSEEAEEVTLPSVDRETIERHRIPERLDQPTGADRQRGQRRSFGKETLSHWLAGW